MKDLQADEYMKAMDAELKALLPSCAFSNPGLKTGAGVVEKDAPWAGHASNEPPSAPTAIAA